MLRPVPLRLLADTDCEDLETASGHAAAHGFHGHEFGDAWLIVRAAGMTPAAPPVQSAPAIPV
ncbi:MAG: hypothetical protein H7338_21835 [Candidatus Sericytochromatia bacterium]|nr:hypothetical protein [Candidatus Sericytochromatia bacterium]